MIGLLHLPPEVRLMIWRLLLPSDTKFVPAQSKQLRDFLRPVPMTAQEAGEQRIFATVISQLLILSKSTFAEVADTFYSANTFCFDIRDPDVTKGQAGSAKSYINHIRLVDRLRYCLPVISVETIISGFCRLKSISIPSHPEPFTVSSFDVNLEYRAMNLSIVRDLLEHLEMGHYEQLLLDYNQPCSLEGDDVDHLLTLQLLRRLRSDQHYIDNKQTPLWLELFIAWIYSYPLKRSKLLKALAKMESGYERNFSACLIKTGDQDRCSKSFTIALSLPQNLLQDEPRATRSCVR